MKIWYFYFFLYGSTSPTSKTAPIVILSDELDQHLKEKENMLETMSQSTRNNDRRSERQSVIINQNHYHIEQMNVNN